MEAGTTPIRRIRLCHHCGEVVGSYEPAVFVLGERVLHSSRAAEPGLAGTPGCRLWHRDCYAAASQSAAA